MQIKPSIVRDIFFEGIYFAFIPADDVGRYWWRQSFTRVAYTGYMSEIYPIGEAFYGIIRPGKWQDYSRKSAGNLLDASANGWSIFYHYLTGYYAEWKIPNGHNRIHCICRTKAAAPSYGVWNLSLGSTSGASDLNDELDFTTLDLGDGGVSDGLNEFVLTITANSAGEKYLRFTCPAGDEVCAVVGVHSFDDDGVGDPSTINGVDSLGEGHDLVDELTYAGNWVAYHETLIGQSTYKLLKSNSCELTIRWKKDGEAGDGKWTSYGPAHFGAGNADFIATNSTELYVGGSLIGKMEDVGVIPRGTLYEDDRLYTYAKGFGDYDEDGGADPDILDIMIAEIGTAISANGIGISAHVEWTANGSMWGLYMPSIPLVDNTSGKVVFPPDRIKMTYTGDAVKDYDIAGASVCEIYPNDTFGDFIGCVITVQSLGPNERIFEQSESPKCKQYHQPDYSILAGGQSPPSGTHWLFGAHIRVNKKKVEPIFAKL